MIENRESLTELGVVTPEIMEVLVDSMAHGECNGEDDSGGDGEFVVGRTVDGRTDGWTETRKREVSADEERLLRQQYLFMEGEGPTRVYTGATPAQGPTQGLTRGPTHPARGSLFAVSTLCLLKRVGSR